jgi:hypothetical protein
MKNRREITEHNGLIEETKARQRNIVFPNTVRNSRNVDAFLWRGSPDAPLVQRMGAWIFGIFFILCGVCFLEFAREKRSWAVLVFSLVVFLLGGKVFLNGFRRHKAKPSKSR